MTIKLKEVYEKEGWTPEQHRDYTSSMKTAVESKNPQVVLDFLEENLKKCDDDTYTVVCEANIESINSLIEEAISNTSKDNEIENEGGSKITNKVQDALDALKAKNSQFDFRTISGETDDTITVTLFGDDSNDTNTFTYTGSGDGSYANFKKWLDSAYKEYYGGLDTNSTVQDPQIIAKQVTAFNEGIVFGLDTFPNELTLTEEQKKDEEFEKGAKKGWNSAKKISDESIKKANVGDNPTQDPETYGTKETGKKGVKTGDDDIESDKARKQTTEVIKPRKGKISKESKEAFESGYEDGYNERESKYAKKDNNTQDEKEYMDGYKSGKIKRSSNESLDHDLATDARIKLYLGESVEAVVKGYVLDTLENGRISDTIKTIKEDAKYLTFIDYKYIVESYVLELGFHGINNVCIIEEDEISFTESELQEIYEEAQMARPKTKIKDAKGSEKENNTIDTKNSEYLDTVSDHQVEEFKKKAKGSMTDAENIKAFELMFDIKLSPAGQNVFGTKLNQNAELGGDGATSDTISDDMVKQFKELTKPMKWEKAKEIFMKMFDIKEMSTKVEASFKTKLEQDDLLGASGKPEETVSDKIDGIGNKKVMESMETLANSMKTMAEGITKGFETLGSKLSNVDESINADTLKKSKKEIIEEAIKLYNVDVVATQVELTSVCESLGYESPEQYKKAVDTVVKLGSTKPKLAEESTVFGNEEKYTQKAKKYFR